MDSNQEIYHYKFFSVKTFGYGDVAVFTNNQEYAEKIKMLRVHGQDKDTNT